MAVAKYYGSEPRTIFSPEGSFGWAKNRTQTFFFLKLFGHFRDIPAKSRDIPPKKFDFPGFEGHTELFGPHPFTWKTPTPPENIRSKKFGFGFVFLALEAPKGHPSKGHRKRSKILVKFLVKF